MNNVQGKIIGRKIAGMCYRRGRHIIKLSDGSFIVLHQNDTEFFSFTRKEKQDMQDITCENFIDFLVEHYDYEVD